tara:strand:+ start:345 stop:560 length:216 start_codon:yes stop_codon:yes gene_type:complete
MSCKLRKNILEALKAEATGSIETARMNVEIYLHNPVGIGEHPNVLAAIQEQLDAISEHQERIEVLDRYFKI